MTTIGYGDRLRRARIDTGMSQTDLARVIDVSTATISRVERGQHDLTAPKLFAWARACGASLEWIAGDPVRVAPRDPSTVELELAIDEAVHA